MSIFVGIQDPIIQKFTIRIAGGYLSSKTGADVRIGRLYISPDFTIQIDHFLVKDLKDNNILKIEELNVRPVMEDIILGNIHVGLVKMSNAEANLITYEDEDQLNFQFLIDAFATDKKKEKNDQTVAVTVDRILVKDLDFQFWNQNRDKPEKTEEQLMDYSHLYLSGINLDAEGLEIIGDSIRTTIHHLAAADTSGFRLNYLESEVVVHSKGILLDDLHIGTPNSNLHLDLHMLYPNFKAFMSFVDSVSFDALIMPSHIQVSDLGPFAKVLYKMTDMIQLEGWMKGPVSSFKVDDLRFAFGDQTNFEGSIALQPLNLKRGNQQLKIKKLNYSYEDLVSFHIPTASGNIPMPSALKPLGTGTIKGYFLGSMEKFKADLLVTSEIGDISAALSKSTSGAHYSIYEGDVITEQFNVGLLTNASKTIGCLDLSANVIARQDKNGDLDIDIEGDASNVQLLGNDIAEISLNGNLYKKCFNGKINVDDDDLDLDFKGRFDFSDAKSLGGDFKMDILSADLKKLNLVKNEETALLSATVTADMTNINNFNRAEGTLSIKDLAFTNTSGDYEMKQFDATIVNDNLLQKRIDIGCDFLNFQMAGKMDFTTLAIAFKQFVNSYVTIPQWTEHLTAFKQSGESSDQDFLISLNVKDSSPLTRLLVPKLSIANNTTLAGSFTSKSNALNLSLRSNNIKFNNIVINNVNCRSVSSPRRIVTRLNMDQIVLRDSTKYDSNIIGFDNFGITTTLQNDSIKTQIAWNDNDIEDHNKATINTTFIPTIEGGRFNIGYADILLFDSLWAINRDNYIAIDSGNIQISNLGLTNGHQSLLIDGSVPKTKNDTLSVSLDQFNLSTLDFLFKGMGFDLDGIITGSASVSDIKDNLTLFANLGINSLGMDGQVYGDAVIESEWDQENKAVDLNFGLINQEKEVVSLEGTFFTERKTDNLDFNLNFDGMDISMLSPFLSSFAQRVQGSCRGNVNIKGSLKEPDIQGSLKINGGGCKVNLLNTFYTFSPTIVLTEDQIILRELSLKDTLGNSALVIGSISHDHLKDMYLDIKAYPRNFLAMATTAGISSSYYGTAIANGIITAQGPVNDLKLSIKAITQKGTSMTIPLGGTSGVKKHDFITFVSHEEKKVDEQEDAVAEKPKRKIRNNINIDLSINVTKDAQIKIALPNSLGNMEAKGEGNIKLGVATSTNSLSLIGDYVIGSGSLSLNIQDILKRNFSLEPGSSISWTGDPVNGTIDVTGVYQTKAAISSLGLVDSTSMGGNNIKVECLVHLKNQLMNPDISFGLRLPNASEDLKEAVFYVIDTTNQSDLLMQVVSLLLFSSFNYGNTVSGVGIITSQVNDFISQFTHDIDININYQPGSEMTSNEMTVDLRKQLFDDRLTIETNFGVVIPNSAYSTNSSNIIGDVNIDYKITKDGRLNAQAFNRSNYNTTYYQYTYYKMVPYTQGLGLSYNRSFDTFKDLFQRRTNNINLPNRPIIDRPGSLNIQPQNIKDNEPKK